MRPKHMGKALTFGCLVETVYQAFDKHQAQGILRLLLKARLVEFRDHNRYLLSKEYRKA